MFVMGGYQWHRLEDIFAMGNGQTYFLYSLKKLLILLINSLSNQAR